MKKRFFIVVKAKRENRLLDEVVLEFNRETTQKRIESEIHMAERDLQKYWNLNGIVFSSLYAETEQDAKRSQFWSVAPGKHSITGDKDRGHWVVIN